MTWILILTLIPHGQVGAAISHIEGFKTVESCLQAGNQWISQTEHTDRVIPKALCIEQQK